VQGIFPFKEARTEEYFYNLLVTGQNDTYFAKVGGQDLSAEFKDLILALFSYDPEKRPTIEQIRAHPWLNVPNFNMDEQRKDLLVKILEKQKEL
jgi:serine/threonine protein kinase